MSLDHNFTLASLTTWALEKNITTVVTMKHDRKRIPIELKPVADMEERSVMHVYNTKEKIMLVSYIDKKKSGKKNVTALSTMHDNVKITKDQRKNPSVHTISDHMERGVSVVDLLSTIHSTRIKSRRFPLNTLTFILDTCRSNAKIILQDNSIKLTSFEMTYNLGKELVLPAIRRRYSQSYGLKLIVIDKIRRALGINEVSTRPQPENFNLTSGRCFKCV